MYITGAKKRRKQTNSSTATYERVTEIFRGNISCLNAQTNYVLMLKTRLTIIKEKKQN